MGQYPLVWANMASMSYRGQHKSGQTSTGQYRSVKTNTCQHRPV